MKIDTDKIPPGKEPTLFEKILAFPKIFKIRIENIFFDFPMFYRKDLGRYRDYLAAKTLIARHPWWLLQWKPNIPQSNSAEKMAFSMVRGPVWRWEAHDTMEYLKQIPMPERVNYPV